jgi:hypothetical protein
MCVAKPQALRYHKRGARAVIDAAEARAARAASLTTPSRRNRAAKCFERGKDLTRPRRGGEIDGFADVFASLYAAIPAVRDLSQGREHGGSVAAARARHVQGLSQDAIGVAELPALGQGFAQLSAEDEHGAHGVVELASKQLAPREVETLSKRHDGPAMIAS